MKVVQSCGNCENWTKGNNEYHGHPVGICSKGFYGILKPMDRIEPYYLEVPVTLDNGNIACGKWNQAL